MDSLHGIIPVGPRTWKGARLIRVDALPPSLPTDLPRDILARCRNENASAELCLSTAGGAPGEVTALIILRVVSAYPYEALDRLERLSGMAMQRLTGANLRCRAVEAESEDARWLERFFTGDLAPISAAAGFYPAEAAPNPGGVYVPGQYGAQGVLPVELGSLIALLSGYPNALISIQMNISQLYPKERRLVRENRDWFAARSGDPFSRTGFEVFSRLDQAGGQPLFLACCACVGSEAFARDMGAQMRLYGLHGYRLPRLGGSDGYVYRGNEWVSAACVRYGHDPHTSRELLEKLGRLTHLAPLEAAAAAFQLPARTDGIKGVRVNRVPMSREPLPASLTRKEGVYIGRHCDTGLPVFIQPGDLTRHGFFVGKPGSGKTTFALGLLYRLYNGPGRIPFLAFEPAKTEYRSLMERVPELRVYTPGREDVAPLQLNPFLPPKGVRLEQYQQDLEAIFAMAISMDHPLDIILPQVISRCYARYGWRLNSTRDSAGVRVFGIHEFIREFRKYIHEHYGGDPETLHNLENGGVVRLMALMKSPMFDTNQSLDVEALLTQPTVVELDALNNASHKALVMGIILTHVMEVVQQRKSAKGELRNLILIDEAHLLLGQSEGGEGPRPVQAVVELLQNMTLILRDYGTALMFGDQSPARLTNVIMDNVELKLMFRLDSRQDRAILADTTQMDAAMSSALASLATGEAYMHCGRLSAPIHIVTPDVDRALGLDRAISDERVRQRMGVSLKPPFAQCAACGCCGDRCDPAVRADGQFLASQLADRPEVLRLMKDPEAQRGLAAFLGGPLERAVGELLASFQIPGDSRLTGCARAQFIRALLISPQFALTEEELLHPEAAKSEIGPEPKEPKPLVMTTFQARIDPRNILEMCAASEPGEDEKN